MTTTKQEINAQYDEMIAEITGTSGQHRAAREMIEGWRKDALAARNITPGPRPLQNGFLE